MVYRRSAVLRAGNRAVYRLRSKLRGYEGERRQHERAVPRFPQPHVCFVFSLLLRLRAADPLADTVCSPADFSGIVPLDHTLGRTLVRAEIRAGVCTVYGAGGEVRVMKLSKSQKNATPAIAGVICK